MGTTPPVLDSSNLPSDPIRTPKPKAPNRTPRAIFKYPKAIFVTSIKILPTLIKSFQIKKKESKKKNLCGFTCISLLRIGLSLSLCDNFSAMASDAFSDKNAVFRKLKAKSENKVCVFVFVFFLFFLLLLYSYIFLS